ncbi:MAG: hypothetical protein ACI93N_002148, partial [Flavobacteriaceae bacterium]
RFRDNWSKANIYNNTKNIRTNIINAILLQ